MLEGLKNLLGMGENKESDFLDDGYADGPGEEDGPWAEGYENRCSFDPAAPTLEVAPAGKDHVLETGPALGNSNYLRLRRRATPATESGRE